MTSYDILAITDSALATLELTETEAAYVGGVLAMAIHTLTTEHELESTQAQREISAATKLWQEATQQREKWQMKAAEPTLRLRDVLIALEAMTADRDAVKVRYDELFNRSKRYYLDLMYLAREAAARSDEEVSATNAVEVALGIFAMYEAERDGMRMELEAMKAKYNALLTAIDNLPDNASKLIDIELEHMKRQGVKHANMFERGEMASEPMHPGVKVAEV